MKILPHKYLKSYDWSIWIDGNLQMNVDAQDLLNTHGHNAFNIMAHPERNCLYAELDTCERLGKDDPSSLNKIRRKLIGENYPVNNGLVQSGVIIRNHNDDTIIGMAEAWWSMVKQYSHRDQTMFNYIVWKYPNTVKKMNLFSANVLYNNFNFYTHTKNGNSQMKNHPGSLYGTLDNHINSKIFFKGSNLLPKRIKR
jgi:hypothetical protein